jgi:hypothetical protein
MPKHRFFLFFCFGSYTGYDIIVYKKHEHFVASQSDSEADRATGSAAAGGGTGGPGAVCAAEGDPSGGGTHLREVGMQVCPGSEA